MNRVTIIGAGPAGIAAGWKLLKESDQYEVIILEESQVVGGISRTVNQGGNRMDIGGHRFFSKNQEVTHWWNSILTPQGSPAYDDKKLGRRLDFAKDGADPEKEDGVFLKRNRVSRIYYKGRFFDYPVRLNKNTIFNMGFCTTISAGFSYLASLVRKLPEESLENFYINRFGKKLYSMFFKEYTHKVWGRYPSEISADWGAQRVRGLSILAVLKHIFCRNAEKETSLIEEFSYPKFGPGQLWETAEAEFEAMGGTLKKGCRVTEIILSGKQVTGVSYEENGLKKQMDCDLVLSSMPLKDLIRGMNEVPEKVRTIAEGLPYRDFVTVGVLVEKLNLKNRTKWKTLSDIIPDCWIYVQDAGVKLGRIQIFNNWSPYMVREPEKTVWMGLEYFCTEGDLDWKKSDEEWTRFAAKELVQMKVISSDEKVLTSHVERVKKAYPAYFGTYQEIGCLEEWLNGIDNLYCIGRNGQHKYNNMDHSVLTAFEAVRVILSGGSDKRLIWAVNTDKAYHESKE